MIDNDVCCGHVCCADVYCGHVLIYILQHTRRARWCKTLVPRGSSLSLLVCVCCFVFTASFLLLRAAPLLLFIVCCLFGAALVLVSCLSPLSPMSRDSFTLVYVCGRA